MWPCGDTMRHISHVGDSLPQGGISSHLWGLPRCSHVPSFGKRCQSLEMIHRSHCAQTERLLARGPVNTNHTVVFLRCWRFLDPCRCSKLSLQGQRSVSATKQKPGLDACQHGPSSWRTVSLPAASPFTQSDNDLAEYERQRCKICFPRQQFQFTESDTLLREYLQCGFHL